MSIIISYFKNVYKARHVLFAFVKLDLKNKYRNSILGFAWTFLTPLGLATIIGIVYSTLFNQPIQEFVPYLFSGLMPWLCLSGCGDGGSFCFLGAAGYIKQLDTPLEIYPLRLAMVQVVNLLVSIGAFAVVCILLKPSIFNLNLLGIFPAALLYLAFGTLWATISGFTNIYIRDFAPLQSLAIQGLFYATPIIYPVENILNSDMYWILKINPFYYFLDIMRSPMLGETIKETRSYSVCIAVIVVLFLITCYLYKKIGKRLAYRL